MNIDDGTQRIADAEELVFAWVGRPDSTVRYGSVPHLGWFTLRGRLMKNIRRVSSLIAVAVGIGGVFAGNFIPGLLVLGCGIYGLASSSK